MAATENIDRTRQAGDIVNRPVAASVHCYSGAIGAVDAAGNANPAADTAGLKVIGTFQTEQNNTEGDAGDLVVNMDGRPQWITNSTGDAVTVAEIGRVVYVEDDETVCKVGGANHIPAGICKNIDATLGVLVDFRTAPLAI